MPTTDIFNFVQVSEQMGTGGQPTEGQFEDAKAEGYQVVINLAPHDAGNNALPDEPGLLQSLGMDYHHIPIDWTAPEHTHFVAFCDAMEKVGDKKVLVHCAANFRVSAMVSSYGVKHLGWTTEQADALINRIWNSMPDYSMNDVWQSFIDEARA
jgi:protein tyrosine phosphatase (PTP) superfamily phosphohydrolase (DUF442 family)